MQPNDYPIVDERLELLFRHAGLSEKQAKLYRVLLIAGDLRASVISQRSGIKRSNCYALLDDMAARGIIKEFEKGNIKYFRPNSPETLVEIIESRERHLQVAKELSNDLVPALKTQWKAAVDRPVVRHFEGKLGLEKVFEDINAPKGGDRTTWGCADFDRIEIEFPEKIAKSVVPARRKNKWFARALCVDNEAGRILHAKDKKELRELTLVNGKVYPLPAQIDVYDDKIALMSFDKKEFVGLIIENAEFAESLRSTFKLAIIGAACLRKKKNKR